MKNFIILSFLIIISFTLKAQNTPSGKGSISGKIVDAVTKVPVDYATISIYKQGSASPFDGTTTDPKGNFKTGDIAAGDYKVTIDFLGYIRQTIDHVIVSGGAKNASLGTINLSPTQSQLKQVNITASAPVVESKIDKLVYNAANDLTSQGGVALDVLKKVPMVTVDIDGNVELQGNANIRFLINGKPSSIFGASLADALQSIPASQIKSIEVITTPGAKYDASGTGGIINIILKDSKVQGFNGSVNLSAGTRLENGSLNLNIRKGNFGINTFFSGNEQINTTAISSSDRNSFNAARDTSSHLFQKGSSAFTRSGYQSGLSLSWSITPKDELTGKIGFNHFGNHNNGLTNQEQQDVSGSKMSDLLSLRNSNSRFSANSTDISLDYKKTFKKEDQELDIAYSSSFGKNTVNFLQETDYLNGGYQPSGLSSNNPGKDRSTEVSVDYAHPLTKAITIETGLKGVFESLNNNINTDSLFIDPATSNRSYVVNANQTYGFNYSRKVLAYYLSSSFSLFNEFLDGKAGLRYEFTTTTTDYANTHIPSYGILAPSFVLSHKLDKTQSVKLSYSYRLERPEYRDLNPFLDISDNHNINTGNPNLKPELGHNYELGYNKSFEKGGNIYIAAFYRYNTNDIQSFTTFYPTFTVGNRTYTNVSLNQRYNIGMETTTGINLYGSVPITEKLNLRSNMFFGDRITNNPGSPQVSALNYRINLNGTYQFGNDLTAEIFFNYRSSQIGIQGSRPAFSFYNLAVRKQFLNKKASIGLTAANPFSQYIDQKSTTFGPNFYQTNIRQVPFRSFGISLMYKFGKLEFKKNKDDNNNIPVPDDSGGGGK